MTAPHAGKLRESEDLCTRVLAARRRMLGDDHAETLDSIHNLGNLRYQMGAQLCSFGHRPSESTHVLAHLWLESHVSKGG